MTSATMTIRLNRKTKDALDRIAVLTCQTNSYVAAEAIKIYVAREQAIVDGIQGGVDDLQAGRTVEHGAAMARLESTIAAAVRAGR